MPRYEFVQGSSRKFWEITLKGAAFATIWGRIGSRGQSAMKSFANSAAAKKEYDRLVAEKTKKGYKPKGAEPPQESKRVASPVAQAWLDIERVLGEQAPAVRRSLAPPATTARLKKLEATLGSRLPADLRESLAIHDGQRGASMRLTTIFNNEFLLSTTEIAKQARMMIRLSSGGHFDETNEALAREKQRGPIKGDRWWRELWLPITGSDGDGYVVDLDPAPGGSKGQVFYFTHDGARPRRVVASSFAEWISSLAKALVDGRFKIEDEAVWLPVKSKLSP